MDGSRWNPSPLSFSSPISISVAVVTVLLPILRDVRSNRSNTFILKTFPLPLNHRSTWELEDAKFAHQPSQHWEPMATISGFAVIPVSYDSSTTHYLYAQPQSSLKGKRNANQTTLPDGRTLFLVNVPPDVIASHDLEGNSRLGSINGRPGSVLVEGLGELILANVLVQINVFRCRELLEPSLCRLDLLLIILLT